MGVLEFLYKTSIGKLCPDTEAVSYFPTDYLYFTSNSQVYFKNFIFPSKNKIYAKLSMFYM